MSRVYSPEQYDWIRENCGSHNDYRSLTDAFLKEFGFANFTSIKSICNRNGFLLGNHKYTEDELWFIENCWKDYTMHEFGEEFRRRFKNNKTDSALRSFLNRRYGKYFKDNDRSSELRRELQFIPVGTVVDRGGREWVKVKNDILKRTENALKNYRPKAVVMYEQLNGVEVPEGKFVTFLDGNTRNYSKENLILVDRKVMAKMSKLGKFSDHDIEYNRTQVMICQLELMAKEDNYD